MTRRLDQIDKRILYRLMADARNTSPPDMASELNVSPGTIRNRIGRLVEDGIITEFTIGVNFERVEKRLTNLFVCTAPIPDRAKLGAKARQIPGIINVRELMSGRHNLHIVAVGTDMQDLTRIGRALSSLGLTVESENLIQRETTEPYAPFGPTGSRTTQSLTDFMSLSGNAQVVELTVAEDAPLAGVTLQAAKENELLDETVLVVTIERDGEMLTATGQTEIRADDVVTLFSKGELSSDALSGFQSAR